MVIELVTWCIRSEFRNMAKLRNELKVLETLEQR